jgi:hypothetical protein
LASRPITVRVARVVGLAVLAVAGFAALAPGVPGLRDAPVVRAASGGCSPSSSTCYLFDVRLGTGPGIGTGFGRYATIDANGQFTGRINCHYGNEEQTGTCGWGYELESPGGEWGIVYKITPDPGSQVCVETTCHGINVVDGTLFITGNYLEARWYFLLLNHVQVDAATKGTGSGTITSDPPGIACPSDCTDLFAANLPVTLTAKATAGSVFAGWSGACSGKDTECVITTDFLVTATATFNKKATPPPVTDPPDEVTEAPPTEEITAQPVSEAPTEAPAAIETVAATQDTTVGSGAEPSPTADPGSAGSSGGGGNLPIVILLGVLLLALAGGAVVAFRRSGGFGGS